MTVLNKHQLNSKVNVPSFVEFQENTNFEFFIFKFHNYFDGLIGLDILSKLNAKIDLENKQLITGNTVIPLLFKPNLTSGKFLITPRTKAIIKVPVDIENGNFFIPTILIQPEVTISTGVYNSENWYSIVEVNNMSNTDKVILIENPIKVQPLTNSYCIEFNNINAKYSSD